MIRLAVLMWLALGGVAFAETMRLAVTTSFHNSGLSDVLLPVIKAEIGLEVQLLVVGTGQALRLGRAGDVDAILVHSKQRKMRLWLRVSRLIVARSCIMISY
jgi:tungstate transport system substrate-binding protein